MLFNSYYFIFIYLPIVLAVFFTCCYFRLRRSAQLSLLVSSLAFYAFWDVRFLPLLGGSIAFNYFLGNLLYRTSQERTKRIYLFLSVTINISILFYFKYLNFFISSTNYLFSSEMDLFEVILPLGISFFTFTQIAHFAAFSFSASA